jgi:hypothetical protein
MPAVVVVVRILIKPQVMVESVGEALAEHRLTLRDLRVLSTQAVVVVGETRLSAQQAVVVALV